MANSRLQTANWLLAAALLFPLHATLHPPPSTLHPPRSSHTSRHSLICEAQTYAGIRHCVHEFSGSTVHVLIVNLNDPRVAFRVTLSAYEKNGGWIECDSTTHCADGEYPFETVPHMLERYAGAGAVAGINTDYFGLSYNPDHGAEGIAVRNGTRLDDTTSPLYVGRTALALSPANEPSLIRIGPRNTPLNVTGRHFNVAGGGPQIVREGKPLDNKACLADHLHVAVCSRLYQTAVGWTADARTMIVAVARYLDTTGLAEFLVREYDVQTAIKFDGGGSAQLAWIDAVGGVQGFDASPNTDGGFRRVAQALLIFSYPLARAGAADFGGITLDEAGPDFSFEARSRDWHVEAGGIGGTYAWTSNKTRTVSEWGRWAVAPASPGWYQVWAFVPTEHATTRSARYEVHHAGGRDAISVDQWAVRGTWASLGVFPFAADGTEFIRLDDATGEAYATTEVTFDAIGLTPVH